MANIAGSEQQEPIRLPWKIFWVAFAVRVLYMTLAHTYRFRPGEDHFQFGWEAGRIARALVNGYGYADPFFGHTGPTAWLPPLYTFIIAAAFKVFGVYSHMAAWSILTLNSIFSALTALAIYEIAYRCFNPRVAVWSGWLWALYPAAMQFAVRWVWEMTLTCMLFSWLIVMTLRMADNGGGTWRQWTIFGALGGLIALTQPTPLMMLPVCVIWIYLKTRPHFFPALQKATAAALIVIAFMTPWVVRNYRIFHTFIPMRDNFGAENYMGNSDWSVGFPWGGLIWYGQNKLQQEYATVGEIAFVKVRGDAAKQWIATHHSRYFQLAALRTYMFWAGVPQPVVPHKEYVEYGREINFAFGSIAGLLGLALALKRKIKGAWLFAAAFLLLPLPYYFVTVQARFRHVFEPLIMILGVYLFQSAEKRRKASTETA